MQQPLLTKTGECCFKTATAETKEKTHNNQHWIAFMCFDVIAARQTMWMAATLKHWLQCQNLWCFTRQEAALRHLWKTMFLLWCALSSHQPPIWKNQEKGKKATTSDQLLRNSKIQFCSSVPFFVGMGGWSDGNGGSGGRGMIALFKSFEPIALLGCLLLPCSQFPYFRFLLPTCYVTCAPGIYLHLAERSTVSTKV